MTIWTLYDCVLVLNEVAFFSHRDSHDIYKESLRGLSRSSKLDRSNVFSCNPTEHLINKTVQNPVSQSVFEETRQQRHIPFSPSFM